MSLLCQTLINFSKIVRLLTPCRFKILYFCPKIGFQDKKPQSRICISMRILVEMIFNHCVLEITALSRDR